VLRFIEYMDVGATNGWRMDEVLPSGRRGACSACSCRWCLIARCGRWTPALGRDRRRALGLPDGCGEIGVISSVTQAFCRDCNRARLSTEGKLFLCLFASQGHDLRALLRGGASDADITTS
jgi:cyclic pyranopterin phosphate synthase